jgi:hypothetical protein
MAEEEVQTWLAALSCSIFVATDFASFAWVKARTQEQRPRLQQQHSAQKQR